MNLWIISCMCILISVGSFIGAVVLLRKMDVDISREKCQDPSQWKSDCEDCCTVWDGSQCRKGKLETVNGTLECKSKGSIWPFILFLVGILTFVMFIIYIVKAIRERYVQ
jgi:hypothetical protein